MPEARPLWARLQSAGVFWRRVPPAQNRPPPAPRFNLARAGRVEFTANNNERFIVLNSSSHGPAASVRARPQPLLSTSQRAARRPTRKSRPGVEAPESGALLEGRPASCRARAPWRPRWARRTCRVGAAAGPASGCGPKRKRRAHAGVRGCVRRPRRALGRERVDLLERTESAAREGAPSPSRCAHMSPRLDDDIPERPSGRFPSAFYRHAKAAARCRPAIRSEQSDEWRQPGVAGPPETNQRRGIGCLANGVRPDPLHAQSSPITARSCSTVAGLASPWRRTALAGRPAGSRRPRTFNSNKNNKYNSDRDQIGAATSAVRLAVQRRAAGLARRLGRSGPISAFEATR
jgi:hypothetical protein